MERSTGGKSGAGGGEAIAAIDGAHVVAAYARWAPIYDWSFGAFTGQACREAVAAMNRLPPSRILEVGVGTGVSLPLYDRKHRIVGIDLSDDMLGRARRKVADERLDHVERLEVMDAAALAFPDRSFDVAIAMFVITVVPDPERVLAEMSRVVRPGGHVVLVSHFSTESGARAFIERRLARFSSKLGWRPNFPIGRVLGRPDLNLTEKRSVGGDSHFTLLAFERL